MTTAEGPAGTTTPGRVFRIAVALGTVYLVWGSTYLALRIMVEEMPALLGMGLRCLAASCLLAGALAAIRGPRTLRVDRSELAACALIGLLLPVGGQGLVTIAEDRGAPSGITALILAAVPLWVTCYRAIAGDQPPIATIIGVLIGLAGAALLIAANGVSGEIPVLALLIVVLASVLWALGTWLLPRLNVPKDPFVLVVYELLIGGAVMVVSGMAHGERWNPVVYSGRVWMAWVYLVVFGSIIGFSAYAWLLQSTSVSIVSTYAYVNPVVALFLGWLLLSEPVTPATLLGALVVVSAVALVVGRDNPPTTPSGQRSDPVEHHCPDPRRRG